MRFSESAWTRRLVAVGVVLVVAGAVSVFAVLARTDTPLRAQGPGVQPLTVAWEPVVYEDGYTVERYFVGRVEARQESDLGFELPGMLSRVHAEEGARVDAGAVVAELDRARLEARRAELRAAAEQARASYELAEIRLRRIETVRLRDAATADEYDEADKSVLAARAELTRAEAAVRSVEVDLGKTRLVAPFDAVVAARYVDDGRVVDAGTPVVRLLERRHPEVRIGVGGGAVDGMSEGDPLDVRVGEREIEGTVKSILPTRDRVGRGVDVLVTLDAEINGLRSGDLARVALQRPIRERGFWVPTQALTEGVRGLWSLYVLEDSGRPEGEAVLRRADVEVLHLETDRVFVRGALDESARFVSGGLHRVAPGMLVRLGPDASDDALIREAG